MAQFIRSAYVTAESGAIHIRSMSLQAQSGKEFPIFEVVETFVERSGAKHRFAPHEEPIDLEQVAQDDCGKEIAVQHLYGAFGVTEPDVFKNKRRFPECRV